MRLLGQTRIALVVCVCFLSLNGCAGDPPDPVETCKLYVAAVSQANLAKCLRYVDESLAAQLKSDIQKQADAFLAIQKIGAIEYTKVYYRTPDSCRIQTKYGKYTGNFDLVRKDGVWRIWNY
jgi:hypothetical protein